MIIVNLCGWRMCVMLYMDYAIFNDLLRYCVINEITEETEYLKQTLTLNSDFYDTISWNTGGGEPLRNACTIQ